MDKHTESLIDAVKDLPHPCTAGAVHAYIDAPFGAFAARAAMTDPLWGMAKNWPAAFANNENAILWLRGMAPEYAALEVAKLPEPHLSQCTANILHGMTLETIYGSAWECAWLDDLEDIPPAGELWAATFTARLAELT